MVGAQLVELDMTDGRVNPLRQLAVTDNGRVLRAALFLQLYHIVTVFGELAPPVGGQPLPALLFKGRGESLGLFSRGFLAPRGGDVKCRRPRLELLAVRAAAPKDTD